MAKTKFLPLSLKSTCRILLTDSQVQGMGNSKNEHFKTESHQQSVWNTQR